MQEVCLNPEDLDISGSRAELVHLNGSTPAQSQHDSPTSGFASIRVLLGCAFPFLLYVVQLFVGHPAPLRDLSAHTHTPKTRHGTGSVGNTGKVLQDTLEALPELLISHGFQDSLGL